jgi:cytochrome c-type biogenesis protein CcmH/NrfF
MPSSEKMDAFLTVGSALESGNANRNLIRALTTRSGRLLGSDPRCRSIGWMILISPSSRRGLVLVVLIGLGSRIGVEGRKSGKQSPTHS